MHYTGNCPSSSSTLPWAINGVTVAIIIGLIIAIVIMALNNKRQLEKLRKKPRKQKPTIQANNEGLDLHLDQITLRSERSVRGHDADLPSHAPQPRDHDDQERALYEEVSADKMAARDVRDRGDGSSQYQDLVRIFIIRSKSFLTDNSHLFY